ncbi:hypothetical protein AMQ83_08095, partial [Paenibacillus riograndensis]
MDMKGMKLIFSCICAYQDSIDWYIRENLIIHRNQSFILEHFNHTPVQPYTLLNAPIICSYSGTLLACNCRIELS